MGCKARSDRVVRGDWYQTGKARSGVVSDWGRRTFLAGLFCGRQAVDSLTKGLNNPDMPRPEAVRRVKSYSAATGYVYQYYFFEVEKRRRGITSGTEYVYMVSADRQHVFPVKIFVRRDALEKWAARTGHELSGTEEYAIAKMRLFQAFDEIENFAAQPPELGVDDSNLEFLLSQLDL